MKFNKWFSQIMGEKGIHPDDWCDYQEEYKEIYEKNTNC